MAEGKEIWCQLFSEPSAGSDVAGLRTKAEKKGDKWIINGQKVWTSGAHYSDFGILVVRHDPNLPKHKGMTFFFVVLKSPGIDIRPIKQITGGSNFNEVYFNDVEIPDSQRLGDIGDGWKVAITTLMNERLAVGDASGADVNEAFKWAKGQDDMGGKLIDNMAARESIADWYCEANGLKNTKLRTMSALSKGDTPGPEASITKIVSANKLQAIDNADIVLSFVFFKPLASQYQSAMDSLAAMLSISFPPMSSCPFAHLNASFTSAPLASPTASLSFMRVVIATFQPSPISPNLWLSGISTSLK
jgi:alkylation response protein AidB-like acyl-CoA dehydrogenase